MEPPPLRSAVSSNSLKQKHDLTPSSGGSHKILTTTVPARDTDNGDSNTSVDAGPSLNLPPSSSSASSAPSSSYGMSLAAANAPVEEMESPWEGAEDVLSRRTSRVQIELAECIETKTVTTTTLTKRTYPPLLIQPPQSLQTLDTKEYPLAHKPTPFELSNFSYEVDGKTVNFREQGLSLSPRQQTRSQTKSLRTNVLPAWNLDSTAVVESPSAIRKSRSARELQPPLIDSALRKSSRKSSSPRAVIDSSSVLRRRQERLSKTRDNKTRRNPNATQAFRLRREEKGKHAVIFGDQIPATPDPSELGSSVADRSSYPRFFESTQTPQSHPRSNEPADDSGNVSDNTDRVSFTPAVATPPIADNDLEILDGPARTAAQPPASRPFLTMNTAAAQNASLPSPSLSPTFAASQANNERFPIVIDDGDQDDSADTLDSADSQDCIRMSSEPRRRSTPPRMTPPTTMDISSMIDTFDSMPSEMKNFMMYQFLSRCNRKSLRVIAGIVNPALKFDFFEQLPPELSLHILSFLDHRDLCRAAQVSKGWRNVIDSNETGWKELFDREGFRLNDGELSKAIRQGWGWQDPHGLESSEKNLGQRQSSPEKDGFGLELSEMFKDPSSSLQRSATKRKRIPNISDVDRPKRRAISMEHSDKMRITDLRQYRNCSGSLSHKSAGPNSAANAAACAVSDPEIGLPSLRKLHLFKSLYRRHHMIRNSWTSQKTQPHHMAFPAHPRNVITCLQFDDDKILTGSDDTFIHVYDTKTGALRKTLQGHDGGVWALQYEGNVLVSGSTDRTVRVWDIEKGICTQVFQGHTSTVRCLQILMPSQVGQTDRGKPIMMPEKPLIITGSRDSQLRVWKLPESGSRRHTPTAAGGGPDSESPYFVRVLAGHTHSVRAIAAHSDTLVSGSYDSTVRVWRISTGETLHKLEGHTMKVYSVVLDTRRGRCISGSMDNLVKIWCLTTGACLATLEGHSSLVGLLDLRDERLVSAAADSTLRVWDPDLGTCKSTLTAHTGAITCFQHDGRKIVSGSDRTLKMWDVRTGECISDLLTDLSGVWQVRFDERRCVAAVQRDNLTFVEVLDFGASRDGVPPERLGRRILLEGAEVDRIPGEE